MGLWGGEGCSKNPASSVSGDQTFLRATACPGVLVMSRRAPSAFASVAAGCQLLGWESELPQAEEPVS